MPKGNLRSNQAKFLDILLGPIQKRVEIYGKGSCSWAPNIHNKRSTQSTAVILTGLEHEILAVYRSTYALLAEGFSIAKENL